MRQLCSACGGMGHGREERPKLRWEARMAERAERRAEAAARAEARRVREAEGPMCYLCGGLGHRRSECALRHRPVCLECGQPGHLRRACPAVPRLPEKQGGADEDSRSECSVATSSTAASTASAGAPAAEEKEMKRLEKKLREISKLVERAAAGEQLDMLQQEKVKRRGEIEVELDTLRGLAGARARDAAKKAAV